jgi:hypothetical protein
VRCQADPIPSGIGTSAITGFAENCCGGIDEVAKKISRLPAAVRRGLAAEGGCPPVATKT